MNVELTDFFFIEQDKADIYWKKAEVPRVQKNCNKKNSLKIWIQNFILHIINTTFHHKNMHYFIDNTDVVVVGYRLTDKRKWEQRVTENKYIVS